MVGSQVFEDELALRQTTNTEEGQTMASLDEDGTVHSDNGASAGTDEKSLVTPVSVGSSCSDDSPGNTRSLTEAEPDEGGDSGSKAQNQRREGGPPKFYRLNASVRESDDDATDDEGNTDSKNNDKSQANPIKVPIHPETGPLKDDTEACTALTTSCSTSSLNKENLEHKSVKFSNVCIRDYSITIGDSPFCSHGVPICLDWSHGSDEIIPLDFFEASHKRRRTARRMLLNSFQRRDMLWRCGYPLEDIERAIKENEREKFRRSLTLYFLPFFHIQEIFYCGTEKYFKRDKKLDMKRIEAAVQKQQMMELQKKRNDTELGGMSIVHAHDNAVHEKPPRRLSFRSQGSRNGGSGGSVNNSFDNDWSVRSGSQFSDLSHDRDDPYAASSNSRFREYSVRVDRGQHDKATEIILCNLQRPHMRAFHSAWFSFFIAFFMWFAITPLLGEVKETLHLSKGDIWLSSLCGTAGTGIMRILIGPACDKFGARLCMAFILASSAIPCALTGLVETAQGLAIVRAFVGIAGSSFVACQYWTSQMFTREVAGEC